MSASERVDLVPDGKGMFDDVMAERAAVTPYPHNDIDAFQVGAKLDFRARVALDLLKGAAGNDLLACSMGEAVAETGIPPTYCVKIALDIADAFVAECERRGYIAPVPTTSEMTKPLRAQGERLGKFHMTQQLAAHNHGKEAQPIVAPAGQTIVPGQH